MQTARKIQNRRQEIAAFRRIAAKRCLEPVAAGSEQRRERRRNRAPFHSGESADMIGSRTVCVFGGVLLIASGRAPIASFRSCPENVRT